MKKIIAILVIMLGFGFTANAQQKALKAKTTQQESPNKAAIKKAALKDVTALAEFVDLSEEQKKKFTSLFIQKHSTLADKSLSQKRKDVLADYLESKIKEGLSQNQVIKLNKNPKLMEILTH